MSLVDLKETHDQVKQYLNENGVLAQFSSYEEIATKSLLIAAAGDLEKRFRKLLIEIPRSYDSPEFLVSFIDTQGIARKFHSMFNWESSNINHFAGLFGSKKKVQIQKEFESDERKKIIKDFIFIGAERNRIVHKGLATESLNHTFDEVWEKYKSALNIVGILEAVLIKPVT